MIIQFSPQYSNKTLDIAREGDRLRINGVEYDFSPLGEGDEIPPEAIQCQFISQPVRRVGGVLHITFRLPITIATFHEKLEPIVDPENGVVKLPVIGA